MLREQRQQAWCLRGGTCVPGKRGGALAAGLAHTEAHIGAHRAFRFRPVSWGLVRSMGRPTDFLADWFFTSIMELAQIVTRFSP